MLKLIVFSLFAFGLLTCVVTGWPLLYALAFGYVLFFLYALLKKHPVSDVLRMSFSGIMTVHNVLLTLLLVGVISAMWRIAGTIPFIVYYAARIVTPSALLISSFLLCCLVSVLTGSAFCTAATVGVICITMCRSAGVPVPLAGGAILSGVFFGDRCSPMSTSALLISELTKTSIFDNLRTMVKTSLIPFLLTCGLYTLLSLTVRPQAGSAGVEQLFAQHFILHPLTLLPALIVIVLALFRVNVKLTLGISIVSAGAIALFVQHVAPLELLKAALAGFQPADPALATLLEGGGLVSMVQVFLIVCVSSCYAGIFQGTGFLDGIQTKIAGLCRRITSFGGIFLGSSLLGMICCNQTLTIMLTHQLFSQTEPRKDVLASHLENTAVLLSALIPWSIAAAVPLATIDAPTACLLMAFYLYLAPLWNLLVELRQSAKTPAAQACPGA